MEATENTKLISKCCNVDTVLKHWSEAVEHGPDEQRSYVCTRCDKICDTLIVPKNADIFLIISYKPMLAIRKVLTTDIVQTCLELGVDAEREDVEILPLMTAYSLHHLLGKNFEISIM